MRYTLTYGLHYTRYLIVLKRYSDANWISDTKDLKFTNKFIFTIKELQSIRNPLNKLTQSNPLQSLEFIALNKASEEAE